MWQQVYDPFGNTVPSTAWFGHEGSILRYVILTLDRTRLSRRRVGHAAGLCLHRHDRALRRRCIARRVCCERRAAGPGIGLYRHLS